MEGICYAGVMNFDPFSWASRFAPEHVLHRWLRVGAAVLCGGFLLHRVSLYSRYYNPWLWGVESGIYVVVLLAYLQRTDPRSRSRGVYEIIIPVVATLFPFSLLLTPVHPAVRQQPGLQETVFWAMTLATGFTVWALWYLRCSFSITVEVRELVTTGPYRLVRHPVYLGEIIAVGAVCLWRFSATNLVLWVVFTALQLLRARLEERKLAATIPAYSDYARHHWWFWRYRHPGGG